MWIPLKIDFDQYILLVFSCVQMKYPDLKLKVSYLNISLKTFTTFFPLNTNKVIHVSTSPELTKLLLTEHTSQFARFSGAGAVCKGSFDSKGCWFLILLGYPK